MLGIIVRIRDEERGNACLVRVERYEYSVQYGIETSPAGEIEKAADSAKLLGHVMVRRPSKHKHVKMTATKNPPPAVPQPPNTPPPASCWNTVIQKLNINTRNVR